MGTPYIGEIRMFAGNFAPAGWALCAGQIMPISENDTLFNLIGTTYGGDGQSTFALPNLQSRVPIHMGNGFTLAQTGGTESVTLTQQQIPIHSHAFAATTAFSSGTSPAGSVLSAMNVAGNELYIAAAPAVALSTNSIGADGGSQPHSNIQPYLSINFIISLFGIYPSQS